MAVSRPEPGPFTNTSTLRMPWSMARRAAASAAICAANGVDFRDPLKPTCPEDAHEMTFPTGSVMETMVLLNVLRMCACPWATFFRSLRRTFFAPVRLLGGICFLVHEVIGPVGGLLLPGLLLAGHGLLPALAGAGVRLRPLAVHGQPTPVADALIAPDLHLAPDVGLHLTAQITLDLVGGVDPVTQLHEVVIGQIVHPDVPADTGLLQRLKRAGTAYPVNVSKRDLKALLAREVDHNQACHLRAVLLLVPEVLPTAPRPCPGGPRPPPGVARDRLTAGRGLRCACHPISPG